MLIRSSRAVIVAASALSLFWILYLSDTILTQSSQIKMRTRFGSSQTLKTAEPIDRDLSIKNIVDVVTARIKGQDTSWLSRYFPEWNHKDYVADDRSAPFTVPRNKGHESMVYLTYIIDNYEQLPDFVFFLHAERFQWHNDDPDFDQYSILKRVKLDYVREQGYTSLHCVWHIGCPREIEPSKDINHPDKATSRAFFQAFKELFPGKPIPEVVSVTCCAQFVVTRETIRTRRREEYVAYRRWLLATRLDDSISGRIFEYLWHIIFMKYAVHCPDMSTCYCKLFGICDLLCNHENCKGQWHFPPDLSLPPSWPRVGWNGEVRDFNGPL